MTTAIRKPPELVSHAEFLAAHTARVAAIHNVKAAELAEIEAETTRAIAAHAKALKVAESEHAAQRIERIAGIVGETVSGLRTAWQSYIVDHGVGRAEVLAKHCRYRDEISQRDLGRPLANELAVSICIDFAEKHPSTNALARFASPDNWARAGDSGIGFFADRANVAIRNPYDVKALQDSLLALESVIARVATSPGYVTGEVDLWPIIAGCWPGDIAEAKRQAHAAEAKVRNIAAHVEESALRVAAARGDRVARETLNARGPGILESVIRNAASILRMTGLSDADAERQAAP